MKQGLGALIDAAGRFQKRVAEGTQHAGRPVKFVIAGAGASRDQLAAEIERQNLENILMLPLQPDEAYREMLVDADCCAITQQPGTGALFFPSKLLTTLAFSKAVLSIADEESDLALAVNEGAFGVNVPPGSPEEVIAALDRWTLPGTDVKALGERGRAYVARFEMKEVLGRFEDALRRLVQPEETVVTPTVPAAPAGNERRP
jgi:colanic acid biosynthesis glycosyl transferase WcaI